VGQRWTAASSAYMSPAHTPSPHPPLSPGPVYSWVGVIMYLPPSQSPSQRDRISRVFAAYRRLMYPLMSKYGAVSHWAKLYLPSSGSSSSNKNKNSSISSMDISANADRNGTETDVLSVAEEYAEALLQTAWKTPYDEPETELAFLRKTVADRFEVDVFNALRSRYDPNNILSNSLVNSVFGDTETATSTATAIGRSDQ